MKKYEQKVREQVDKHMKRKKGPTQDAALFKGLKELERRYYELLTEFVADARWGRREFFKTDRGMRLEVYCLNTFLHTRLLGHNTIELWRTAQAERAVEQPTGMERRDWERFVKKIDKHGQVKKDISITPFKLAFLLRDAVHEGVESIRRVFQSESAPTPLFRLATKEDGIWQRHKQFWVEVKKRFFPESLPIVEALTTILSEQELSAIKAAYDASVDASVGKNPFERRVKPSGVMRWHSVNVIGSSRQVEKKQEKQETFPQLTKVVNNEVGDDFERISGPLPSSHQLPQECSNPSYSFRRNTPQSLVPINRSGTPRHVTQQPIVRYAPGESNLTQMITKETKIVQGIGQEMISAFNAYIERDDAKHKQWREEYNRKEEERYQQRERQWEEQAKLNAEMKKEGIEYRQKLVDLEAQIKQRELKTEEERRRAGQELTQKLTAGINTSEAPTEEYPNLSGTFSDQIEQGILESTQKLEQELTQKLEQERQQVQAQNADLQKGRTEDQQRVADLEAKLKQSELKAEEERLKAEEERQRVQAQLDALTKMIMQQQGVGQNKELEQLAQTPMLDDNRNHDDKKEASETDNVEKSQESTRSFGSAAPGFFAVSSVSVEPSIVQAENVSLDEDDQPKREIGVSSALDGCSI
ncbi:MAG: hypothetical protein K2Q14_07375, partial [Gammaproteobacteria bacterium]|nr:hypothetical protein [Gammaproteobacteria bacterium]